MKQPYKVKCSNGEILFKHAAEHRALGHAESADEQLSCGPHTVWFVDEDGTETEVHPSVGNFSAEFAHVLSETLEANP